MKISITDDRIEIVDFSELEAYKIASKIERDGIEFYSRLKDSVSDTNLSKTCDFLISEEKKHLNLFEKTLSDKRSETEDNFEEDDLLGSIDYGIFQPFKDSNELNKILPDPKKAIKLGIIIEKRSIAFYQACKINTANDSTKRELDLIIQEEEEHQAMLEQILLSL